MKSHLQVFPPGQFVAVEEDGEVVGSAGPLIVTLNPEYAEHTWKGITSNGMFTDHEGIGSMLYGARKELVLRLGLRRMIVEGDCLATRIMQTRCLRLSTLIK